MGNSAYLARLLLANEARADGHRRAVIAQAQALDVRVRRDALLRIRLRGQDKRLGTALWVESRAYAPS